MPKLPIVSGKKLLKALKKNGYSEIRRKGSHVFVKHKLSGLGTVIPVHGNEDLGKGLLKSIIDDLQMGIEELIVILR